MKNITRIAVTALLATASVAAFAQSNSELAARDQANSVARNNYPVVIFHSTESRAAVQAELAASAAEPATTTSHSDYQMASQSKKDSSNSGDNAALYQGA